MPKNGLKTLGNCLPGDILQRLLSKTENLRLLQQAWRAAVEPQHSKHAEPIRFEHGRLILRLHSSAMTSRMRHQKLRLIALLQHHPVFKGLQEIEFRTRPHRDGHSDDRAQNDKPVRALSVATQTMLLGVAESVQDPALSAALKRLAERKHNDG